MGNTTELKKAIHIRTAMEQYQDTAYINIMRQLNEDCQAVLTDDLGTEFVKNCGRDFAGEIVRNCFDTANYGITVDQMAKRMLEFSYDNEYDPLADNGGVGQIQKSVYASNEIMSSDLDAIADICDASQEKLFTESRDQDKLDRKGKNEYRASKTDENGDVYDELTGKKGTKSTIVRNGKEVTKSDLQADHVQSREAATYNSRYLKESGKEALKEFWNSSDNMQMMHASANASKGDIRVCKVNGEIKYVNARSKDYDPSTDITYKATPKQLAEATCEQWESTDSSREGENSKKIEKLKEQGYLDEDGKVPKSVKIQLEKSIRHSQNEESKIILKETDYTQTASDALDITKGAIGKIIAGQIIYYSAPPLLYELRMILKDKTITLDNALEKLGNAAKRIGEYVASKLKNIFANIVFGSLKKFIKSFMDILINTVKATIKKLLKVAKSLVLSTVDAVRIIADKNTSRAEKANALFNLYGVTITSCVIEILFELAGDALGLKEPFDDIIFGPLQILVTILCTNLTLLILKKADLFNVEFGFKMSKIRKLFETSRLEYEQEYALSKEYADTEIQAIIEQARQESVEIYQHMCEFDPKYDSAREDLERINRMFSIGIDFETEWLNYIGISV